MSESAHATQAVTAVLSESDVARYRRDGFVRVRNVLTPDEVVRFRTAAKARFSGRAAEPTPDGAYFKVFTQIVNV